MLPSSGAIALRPSEARPLTPHSCEISAIPSGPTPSPPHASGRCGVKMPPLARAVAQPLDDVPAAEHVGGVLDLGLRGQRFVLDVGPDAVDQVPQLGREREVQRHGGDPTSGAAQGPAVSTAASRTGPDRRSDAGSRGFRAALPAVDGELAVNAD